MIFRSIADREDIARLVSCSAKQEASTRWVNGSLDRGESRLQWCRMAVSEGGDVLAAHAMDSWSPDGPPGDRPTFVQLLGHSEEAAAVALLKHDLSAFKAGDVEVRLVSEVDASPELSALRVEQHRVLEAAGFGVEVDRVKLEWLTTPRPRAPVGLTFKAVKAVAEEELLEVFAAVGDGSVDHGMVTGRAEYGRGKEAAMRLGRARRRTYKDNWFVVGSTLEGAPIGYVQSTMSGDQAVLAEIGVVEAQRGHRYVDDLLAHGTGVLVDQGQINIRAFTDAENHAMRAAFERGGYAVTGGRRDFRRPPGTAG